MLRIASATANQVAHCISNSQSGCPLHQRVFSRIYIVYILYIYSTCFHPILLLRVLAEGKIDAGRPEKMDPTYPVENFERNCLEKSIFQKIE